ncbi:MAG: putative metal-binding motif-containing protein [Myxococcota bacterium]
MNRLFGLMLGLTSLGCSEPETGPSTRGLTNDEGLSSTVDQDGDGSLADEDCDDANATVYPGADEVCNDIDDDCDGLIDDEDALAAGAGMVFYADADGDGFGDPAVSTARCQPAAGVVDNSADCDDTLDAVHPDAVEICNDIDDDCDALVDDNDASLDPSSIRTWFVDGDGDGYGDGLREVVIQCAAVDGRVANGTDCDDADNRINPGQPERCDGGVDNDCDPMTSEDGTVHLGDDVFGDLQTALDTATDGDALLLCGGTFVGPFTASADVTVTSMFGADTTTLAGAPGAPVLTVTGSLNLSGVTVTGGEGLTGGGIDATASDGALLIEDCTFQENVATDGGAIGAGAEATVTIRGGLFVDNLAAGADSTGAERGAGGAIYATELTLEGVLLESNRAYQGGAVAVIDGVLSADAATQLANNEALANAARDDFGHGGAIYASGSAVDLDGAAMSENTGVIGGALYVNGGSARLSSVDIANNTAASDIGEDGLPDRSGYGGGIAVFNVDVDLTGESTIAENEAADGGGLYASGADLNVDGSTFTGNLAWFGGGVFLDDSTLSLDDASVLAQNEAMALTDADGVLRYGGEGGGVAATNNSAITAGGARLQQNLGWFGGGARITDASMSGGDFRFNIATNGGGAHVEDGTFSDAILFANSGDFAGGVLGAGASVTLRELTLSINDAVIDGGGAYIYSDTATIEGCTFETNETARVGGGVHFAGETVATIQGSTFTGNYASDGGGVGVTDGSVVTIAGSVLEFNESDGFGGGAWVSQARLRSDDSDWDSNEPDDVYVDGADSDYTYGSAASFTCDASGCATP